MRSFIRPERGERERGASLGRRGYSEVRGASEIGTMSYFRDGDPKRESRGGPRNQCTRDTVAGSTIEGDHAQRHRDGAAGKTAPGQLPQGTSACVRENAMGEVLVAGRATATDYGFPRFH